MVEPVKDDIFVAYKLVKLPVGPTTDPLLFNTEQFMVEPVKDDIFVV